MRTVLALLATACALATASPFDSAFGTSLQERDECNAYYIGALLPLSVGNQPCGDPDGNHLSQEIKSGPNPDSVTCKAIDAPIANAPNMYPGAAVNPTGCPGKPWKVTLYSNKDCSDAGQVITSGQCYHAPGDYFHGAGWKMYSASPA